MKERTKIKFILWKSIIILLVLILTNKFAASNYALAKEQEKVIYLTFDDGPSFAVTNQILYVLKEKNIKSTFFVVGYKIPGKEKIITRIHQEGHSIGLHSYTHNMKKIYSSEYNFINEMDLAREEVKKVIGISPTAIRFPGGSKPHLNQNLLNKLHQKGYKIIDWNACVPDGIDNQASANTLFIESKKVIGRSSKVILLLHDDEPNTNTWKALPQIIDFYKKQGYKFKGITNDTPEFHFRL